MRLPKIEITRFKTGDIEGNRWVICFMWPIKGAGYKCFWLKIK